jgi:hypothetical protein
MFHKGEDSKWEVKGEVDDGEDYHTVITQQLAMMKLSWKERENRGIKESGWVKNIIMTCGECGAPIKGQGECAECLPGEREGNSIEELCCRGDPTMRGKCRCRDCLYEFCLEWRSTVREARPGLYSGSCFPEL